MKIISYLETNGVGADRFKDTNVITPHDLYLVTLVIEEDEPVATEYPDITYKMMFNEYKQEPFKFMWALFKTPSGAGRAKDYKLTADFPAEGKNTAIIYGYTKIGKYVSDEPLAKGLKQYANTDDPKTVTPGQTIPFIAGKKAQFEGKDLPLVDKNDPKKGYSAPQPKIPSKHRTFKNLVPRFIEAYINDSSIVLISSSLYSDDGKQWEPRAIDQDLLFLERYTLETYNLNDPKQRLEQSILFYEKQIIRRHDIHVHEVKDTTNQLSGEKTND